MTDQSEQPSEPKRVIHEVCRLVADTKHHRWRLGTGENGDDSDPLIRLDEDGIVVISSVTMYEHETYDPPPWVRHGVENRGWWIRHRPGPPSGLTFHGAVDWKSVAVGLAEAMTKRKTHTQAEQAALDGYLIALAEEAVAQPDAQRTEEGEDYA